jgi:hypothetical protein
MKNKKIKEHIAVHLGLIIGAIAGSMIFGHGEYYFSGLVFAIVGYWLYPLCSERKPKPTTEIKPYNHADNEGIVCDNPKWLKDAMRDSGLRNCPECGKSL